MIEFSNKNEITRKEFDDLVKSHEYEVFDRKTVQAFRADVVAKNKSSVLTEKEQMEAAIIEKSLTEVAVRNDDLTVETLYYRAKPQEATV